MPEHASDQLFEHLGRLKAEAVALDMPEAAFMVGRIMGYVEGLDAHA